MKIGEFAAFNNISIDTVRHYADLGLIIPARKGAQFTYDERCAKDLLEILELKEMGFTLNEVKAVLTFKRLGNLTSYQENPIYRNIFENRYKQLEIDIGKLQESRAKLENRLAGFEGTAAGKGCRHGFDFRSLDLFCCAGCGGSLALLEAHITDNLVMDARLGCKCGRHYTIEDGIFLAGDAGPGEEINYDLIADYIETTDEAYLRNVYRGMEWIGRKLGGENTQGRILLELGSGYGYFLRHVYEELPENTIYIAVDHDISMHRFLKAMLEKSGLRKNILFVCSDLPELPLKAGVADVILDLAGTSNYSFEHEDFLPGKMAAYGKADSCLLGSYILFEKFAADSSIGERFRKNFRLGHIKQMLEDSGYDILDEASGDFLENGGKYENYFKKGERVNYRSIYAKKRCAKSGVNPIFPGISPQNPLK